MAEAPCILCGGTGSPRAVRGMTLFRCGSCGFQWSLPVLSSTHYDTFTVDLAEAKLKRRQRNCLDRVRILRRNIPDLHPSDSIYDIGCGEGLVLQALREAGFTRVCGVEPHPQLVAFAQAQGLTVEQGTLESALPFVRQRQPRVVTLFHVIEHLPDPLAALRTLRSAMLPGSFIVLETPDMEGYSARVLGDDWPLVYEEHLSYFTQKTLRSCLELAGFVAVAEGKRDFDQEHLGIGDLLFRLGLRKPKRPNRTPSPAGAPTVAKPAPRSSAFRRVVASFLSVALSRVVILLGRVDYLWMIARVPEGKE